MTKKFYAYAMLLAVSTIANAAPFNGGYLGANAGSEARIAQYNDKNASTNNQYTKSNVTMIAGLFAGYMHTYAHGLSLGGEFGLMMPASNKEDKLLDQSNGASPLIRYTRGIGFKLAPRIGHSFDKLSLFYATLGIECSRDKVTFKDVARGNNLASASKTVLSFNPGFGFERAIHNWVGGLEYSYSIGKKFSTPEMNANAGRTLDAQRRSHQVMFRVSYAFR